MCLAGVKLFLFESWDFESIPDTLVPDVAPGQVSCGKTFPRFIDGWKLFFRYSNLRDFRRKTVGAVLRQIDTSEKSKASHFKRGSRTVKPITILLGMEPVFCKSDKDDQN